MPNSVAPTMRRKKRRKKREVFIVGRPLKLARQFAVSFVSDGKFPLCHWGLFMANERDCDRLWTRYRETKDPNDLPSRGTLFELLRLEDDKISCQKKEDFGLEDWEPDWNYVCIVYAGRTSFSDELLSKEAMKIVKTYPDYQFYTNNCQNFVLYLHAFACPDSATPKTIKHAVQDTLDRLSRQRDGIGSTLVVLVVLFD